MPEQKLPRRIEPNTQEYTSTGFRNFPVESKCAVFLENEQDNLVGLIQYAEKEGYKTDLFYQTNNNWSNGHLSLIKPGEHTPEDNLTRYAIITSETINDAGALLYRLYVVKSINPKNS